MCIIVACPPGKRVDRYILQNCWNNNDDGAGMMYVRNDKIRSFKILKGFPEFYQLYLKHIKHAIDAESPTVLHFRIATHGSICLENTHPFVIDDDASFCHNGVINIKTEGDRSDTRQFNEDFLKRLPKGFYKNKAIRSLLETKLVGNKVVILSRSKKIYIINHELGEFDKESGIWFSNGSYRCDRSVSTKKFYGHSEKYLNHDEDNTQEIVADTDSMNCGFCNKKIDMKVDSSYFEISEHQALCVKCAQELDMMNVVDIDDKEVKNESH